MGLLYNLPTQTHVRKYLRNHATEGERSLWQFLKGSQLGVKFRRQYGIGNAVADFYCPQARLAIEIDGSSHHTKDALSHDRRRQNEIESLGIKVIRFSESDAVHDTRGVVREFERILEEPL